MPHSKFGWSLPPGCTHLPGDIDDPDDTRCGQCHRDLDQAWEDFDDRPDEATDEDYEKSPMFEGFCCWACARDYQATLVARNSRPNTCDEKTLAAQIAEFNRFVELADGAEAPLILTEEEAFGPFYDDYDPCDDPENPEVARG